MKRKGLTLVEIMAAVGTLCIILAFALPIFSRMRQTANETKIQAELSSLYKAYIMFYGHTGRFPQDLSELSDYITIHNIEDKYELNPNLG